MKDTIFRGGYVLSMDAQIGDIIAGDVHVRGDRIEAVAEHVDVPGAEIIDARGAVVSPRFVDGHRHAWQSLLRGLASDWSFPKYMVEARALYSGCFDSDAAYTANLLDGVESLNAGVTTIVDHSHLQTSPEISDALVRGFLDSGVGGFSAMPSRMFPSMLSAKR